jgi:uncharacterized protein (DUF3084 family)
MSEAGRPEVTLHTLHQDLGEVRSDLREVKTDIREVKALLTTRLPAPDWPGEMLRTLRENTQFSRENTQLLRENNRISEERFTRLDVTLREQAIETHTVLRTVAEGQRQLSADTRALIARIDALIRGRGDGAPAW